MIGPRKLDQSGVGNAGCQFATALHADQGVICHVQDKGWNLNGVKNSGNVDVTIHAHERHSGGRAGAEPFELTPPLLYRNVFCFRRSEHRETRAATPMFVDISDQCVETGVIRYPVEKTCKATIDDERLGPLGMTGGEKRGERAAF